MATTSTTTSKVSLKLLINRESKKVLFAEAGKDFVDFLFNLLALPVGTVIRLRTKNSMVGSLGNLYDSIENFDETYLQTENTRDALLKPKAPPSLVSAPLLSLGDDTSPPAGENKFYYCASHIGVISDNPRAICPHCKHYISTVANFVTVGGVLKKDDIAGGEGGFVKGVVTYMIMDDLVVNPMSTISSIALLNKFNVKEVGALEEKVVQLGMDQIPLMVPGKSIEYKNQVQRTKLKLQITGNDYLNNDKYDYPKHFACEWTSDKMDKSHSSRKIHVQ